MELPIIRLLIVTLPITGLLIINLCILFVIRLLPIKRTLNMRGEAVTSPMNMRMARDVKDALVKGTQFEKNCSD